MEDLILFHGEASVCSIKVRLALAEMGLEWKSHILDLRNGEQFADWYLRLNPNAVVPTLKHGDFVVRESSVIIDHLDRIHAGPRLLSSSIALQTLSMLWLVRTIEIHAAINSVTFATNTRDVFRSWDKKKQDLSLERLIDPVVRNKRRDLYEKGLRSDHAIVAARVLNQMVLDMDKQISESGGPWLMGNAYSLADITLFAYVDRLDRLNMSGFWKGRFPRVDKWVGLGQTRPSYEKAVVNWVGGVQGTPEAAESIWSQLSAYV